MTFVQATPGKGLLVSPLSSFSLIMFGCAMGVVNAIVGNQVHCWHRVALDIFFLSGTKNLKFRDCGCDQGVEYLLHGSVVTRRLRAMGIRDKPTAPASLWRNGFAERLIGSIRRECVDHIIVLGEMHLRRVLKSYADYYHCVRTHRSLNKDEPVSRPVQRTGVISSRAILGRTSSPLRPRLSCRYTLVAKHAGPTGRSALCRPHWFTRRERKETPRERAGPLGNARVRRCMIQLAWRFLLHQKNSALTKWFRSRTENARGTRKPMIVALARKLPIALWRLVREGIVPDGVVLRAAQ